MRAGYRPHIWPAPVTCFLTSYYSSGATRRCSSRILKQIFSRLPPPVNLTILAVGTLAYTEKHSSRSPWTPPRIFRFATSDIQYSLEPEETWPSEVTPLGWFHPIYFRRPLRAHTMDTPVFAHHLAGRTSVLRYSMTPAVS